MHVSFLIAGTQKGGTTALHAHLRDHPGVCMSDPKEVHFFDDDRHFAGGPVDYAPLHAAFHPRPGQTLGEATPITMYWAEGPRRVWAYNPAMKIVGVLRNPIDRAYSHWNMERVRGADDLPFGEAVRREAERCRSALPFQHRVYSYTDRGFYSEQVRRLWRFFPRDQTLFLRSEDLRDRPDEALARVFALLGLGAVTGTPRAEHVLEYPGPMDPRDRAFLADLYRWEVRELERLLGWDCGAWLN